MDNMKKERWMVPEKLIQMHMKKEWKKRSLKC